MSDQESGLIPSILSILHPYLDPIDPIAICYFHSVQFILRYAKECHIMNNEYYHNQGNGVMFF